MDMKQWIRLARKKVGLTQEQLAERLGLTKGNISAWENGRHEASFAQLSAISELSGLKLPLRLDTLRAGHADVVDDGDADIPVDTLPEHARLEEVFREYPVDDVLKKVGLNAAEFDHVIAKGIPLDLGVKIQEATGYNAVWIILGKGPKKAVIQRNDDWNPIPIPPATYRKIPVLAMAQLGDNGHFVDMEYPVGHGDGYLHFFSTDPDAYGLRCVGDSMEPRIKDGEFVVIEPNHAVTNGDEVLVKSKDGRVMVKILGFARDGYTSFLSVNQKHGIVKIQTSDIEKIDFVAAIVKASAWRPD